VILCSSNLWPLLLNFLPLWGSLIDDYFFGTFWGFFFYRKKGVKPWVDFFGEPGGELGPSLF